MYPEITPEAVREAIRTRFPRARRARPVGIVVNTSRRRVVQCIVCGATESCCNDYPETAAVRKFRESHDRDCGRRLVNEIARAAIRVRRLVEGAI